MEGLIECIYNSIEFSNKIDKSLINAANNVIEKSKIDDNIDFLIRKISKYIYSKNNVLADIEIDVMELQYYHSKIKEQQEYIELFIEINDFINEKISIFNFIKFDFNVFNTDFMKWFLNHSGELKRELSFEEMLVLNQKFELSVIMNYEFNTFSELNKLIDYEKQ